MTHLDAPPPSLRLKLLVHGVGLALMAVAVAVLAYGAFGGGRIWMWVGGLGTVAVSLGMAQAKTRLLGREPIRPPMRRYLRRFGVSMSAYVILLLVAVDLYHRGLTAGALGYVIALAPALPILGCILAVGLYLAEETDEFCRQALIQALLWAAAVTLAVSTVWGFLETFGKAPHVWAWAVVPLFAVVMGVAQWRVARRYR